jgi:hypothetical protein
VASEISETMRVFAEECEALVLSQFGVRLDWTLDSLVVADNVCLRLLSEGPLAVERIDLWMKLLGAYTGEVLIRAYEGSWVFHDNGDVAVGVYNLKAFPLSTVRRILQGEVGKSLASVGRAIPSIQSDETSN